MQALACCQRILTDEQIDALGMLTEAQLLTDATADLPVNYDAHPLTT